MYNTARQSSLPRSKGEGLFTSTSTVFLLILTPRPAMFADPNPLDGAGSFQSTSLYRTQPFLAFSVNPLFLWQPCAQCFVCVFWAFSFKVLHSYNLSIFPGEMWLKSQRPLWRQNYPMTPTPSSDSSVFSHHSLHKLDFKILSKILLEKKRLGPVDRSDDSASLCPGTTWNKPQERKFSATKFKLGYKSHLFSCKLVSFLLIFEVLYKYYKVIMF